MSNTGDAPQPARFPACVPKAQVGRLLRLPRRGGGPVGFVRGESHMSIKDRVDDACRVAYDATNGSVSAGDIFRAVYSCSAELPK